MSESTVARVPVHLWIVGALSLLWNGYGCFDYLMTKTRNASYLASLTAEQMAVFERIPGWVDVAWAVGVWGALLGSMLLLLRRRWAVHAFRLSLLGAAVVTAYQIRVAPQPLSNADWALTIAVLVVGLALVLYARWQIVRGVLR
jgi:hypothetical protein